ncbi:L-rhamnose mutarotase [Maribacter sp. PR1]|uniref:L-rhamnose mutarotase n=1 Tax=Maribacter cobaltidurans TaxID=1178778 RepID=A0ABU7IPB6_9FLAO|nr:MULTISPECIES: L-rhamnose mutarotase [Maribacter]MDC6387423.1 L-rhamnose mutarotase [Maribacter sp. PR1]MEE1974810.1 L-rhamnose mutarotase [Maribacter cobaltidurans]
MKTARRFCYACDLVKDSNLIAQYKEYHSVGKVWPEITESIKAAGIVDMEIFLVENRLFMIVEVDETFSPERKKKMDDENPKVKEWEQLMWKFQQALPSATKGEKWVATERIFKLD